MAVVLSEEKVTYESNPVPQKDSTISSEVSGYVLVSMAFSIKQSVIQKVWDTAVGGGEWVPWKTDELDITGTYYPYPSNWGVSTSLFRIEDIIYEEVV
jgi:hypothetical protein